METSLPSQPGATDAWRVICLCAAWCGVCREWTPVFEQLAATHPQVHFHFTPKGATWLNMVEARFSILTRKSVRRG